MGVRNTKFHTAPLRNLRSRHFVDLSQFHREISVIILFVDVAQGVT